MKALILAAGYGRRLQPLTNTIPKSMVPVNEIPLLVNALNNLIELGISQIGIVVGHMADYIRANIGNVYNGAEITYFENEKYLETNNIYSLWCAKEFCDDEMLLLESDLYYKKNVIEALLKGAGDCSILVSEFDSKTMDGTVIKVAGTSAIELVLGAWQSKDFDYSNAYKTVNMYKFSQMFARNYLSLVDWYVKNMGVNSYYEKVLGSMMFLKEVDIRVVNISSSMWWEIDDLEDLYRVENETRNQ